MLELGKRTFVMGVLNVTPDSFSDGGAFLDPERAVEHGLKLLDDGADIIDVGGESTRPGARVAVPGEKVSDKKPGDDSKKSAVTEKEELQRVIPVITQLKQKRKDALISIDTYKASVARAAVEAGAQIVNDVSGFRWDSNMAKTIAELNCGAIMMHMRGRPEEWRNLPPVADIVLLIKREISDWTQEAARKGIKRDKIVVDPGIGFGKNFEQNFPVLKRFEEFHTLRFPLLIGISRKSFVGRTLAKQGKDAPVMERLHGTLAAETAAILRGAHILRTHDVKASVEAARMTDKIA